MQKEYHHETFWIWFLTAALAVYLLRVFLIAGEGKEEPEVAVGRFSVDVTFSEEGEFLPPSYLEAARDQEFKEPFICLGYQERTGKQRQERKRSRSPGQPESQIWSTAHPASRIRRLGHTGTGSSMSVRERRRSFI